MWRHGLTTRATRGSGSNWTQAVSLSGPTSPCGASGLDPKGGSGMTRPKSPTWPGDPEGYTDYGFSWGPAEIMRAFDYRGRRMVLINTDTVSVEVVISPKEIGRASCRERM